MLNIRLQSILIDDQGGNIHFFSERTGDVVNECGETRKNELVTMKFCIDNIGEQQKFS